MGDIPLNTAVHLQLNYNIIEMHLACTRQWYIIQYINENILKHLQLLL